MKSKQLKYTSLVFETPPSPYIYYVYPTVNDEYDDDDIECEVIQQSVQSDVGPTDNHWRCKKCFHRHKRQQIRRMPLQGRYARGEWLTVNDYFIEEQFSLEEIKRYRLYYRYSHLLIMRGFLADDGNNDEQQQLPKGVAEKLCFYCSIHSTKELKDMIESDNQTEWNATKLLLQDNNSALSMTDYEIILLKNKVRSLVRLVVDEWYTEAELGNKMYMRQCTEHLKIDRKQNRDGRHRSSSGSINTADKKKTSTVRSARSSKVSKNTDSECRTFGCNCIIKEKESEKFQLMSQMCVTCFVAAKKKIINRNFRTSEEKKNRERECQDNHPDADDTEHTDPNIVLEEDIDCYFSNQPCRRCTQHHAKCHAKIIVNDNVPKKEFCGCAVNCPLHEHRGTMSDLEDTVFKTLNLDDEPKLVKAVNNYVQIQKLCWLEGHEHLTEERELEQKKKILKYLSMVIVARSHEWDHMSRNQKQDNVSDIKNDEKRWREIQFCVLRDRSCHRFKTFFETADAVHPQGTQRDYIVEWKRKRFKKKGNCCTLLRDLYGKGVSCPFGYGTHAECAAHIVRVENLLKKNKRDDVDPLKLYLRGCFDIHHKDPNTKKGEWMEMKLEEMRELLEEQGMLTCIGCHILVTALLRQDRNQSDYN